MPDPAASWIAGILACPRCGENAAIEADTLSCPACGGIGQVAGGVLRLNPLRPDAAIDWYKGQGGARIVERSRVPFTMTSLDTPIYQRFQQRLMPTVGSCIVADVGAGDGRNAEVWLRGGHRVIAIDAVGPALERLRARIAAELPEALERLALIEADIARLPLRSGSADVLLAIESLYYLNERYEEGLAECARVTKASGRLLIAERSWEGAIHTQLLYGGLAQAAKLERSRYVWDGPEGSQVKSRSFTEAELRAAFKDAGLEILDLRGTPLVSLLIGYLNSSGKLGEGATGDDANRLAMRLAEEGGARRTHVVTARRKP